MILLCFYSSDILLYYVIIIWFYAIGVILIESAPESLVLLSIKDMIRFKLWFLCSALVQKTLIPDSLQRFFFTFTTQKYIFILCINK